MFKSGKYTHDDYENVRAKIVMIITKEDVNKYAKEWDKNDINRCNLIAWLKSTPLPDVNATVMNWVNKKFIQAQSPYDNLPTWEQMNLNRLALVFDRPLFKKTVNHIIDKFRLVNREELWIKIREDEEEHINNYVMQYLSYFYDSQSATYNVYEIKRSLSSRLKYYQFIVSVVQQNNKVKFTNPQMEIIKKSLVSLINAKGLKPDLLEICLVQILKYDIELDRDVIIRLLPFAGVEYCTNSKAGNYFYFIEYALKRLGADLIKSYLPELIVQPPVMGNDTHTEKIAELIVRLQMTNLYPQICNKIKTSKYSKIQYVQILLKDKTKGIDILKSQIKHFSTDVQLHIIEQLARLSKDKKWVTNYILTYRQTFTPDENRNALLILLYLGEEQALGECIEWLRRDVNSLCNSFMAPSLNYTDIKYLPQLIMLLRIVWDAQNPYSNWRTRVEKALTNIAEKNLSQFIAVNDAINNLIVEDNKYCSLNYFIGQLQKSDPRLKESSISISQAIEIINKNKR